MKDVATRDAKVLQHDPLREAEVILRDEFYGRGDRGEPRARPRDAAAHRRRGGRGAAAPVKAKPSHYKVMCISMYTQDIEALEAKVAELKRRGYTKASKSQLIRFALRQVDIDKLPPSV
jgi:hypothetical protein